MFGYIENGNVIEIKWQLAFNWSVLWEISHYRILRNRELDKAGLGRLMSDCRLLTHQSALFPISR